MIEAGLASMSSSTMLHASVTERASRSSLETTRVVPGPARCERFAQSRPATVRLALQPSLRG